MSAKETKEAFMELTERKKKVLRSIVDLYIRTAEPVGSKAIAELPDMNYSSATIWSSPTLLQAVCPAPQAIGCMWMN